jgi:YbbR domain-containing protein
MSEGKNEGQRRKRFALFDLSAETNKKKWIIRVLSLFSAVVLWLFVTWDGSALSTRVMSVPLRQRDVPDGYLISCDVKEISVKLGGRVELLAIIARNSISAAVSVQDMTPGKYGLPVHLSLPDGVRALDYSPQIVECELLRLIERRLKPSLSLTTPLPDGIWLDDVRITPAEVAVKGREADVLAVRRAEARVVSSDLGSSASKGAQIVLMGDAGEIKGLNVEPASVTVRASLIRSADLTRIPVRAQTVGLPGGGLSVGSVTVSPDTVAIRGTGGAAFEITEIVLDAIDVTGHTEDMNIDVPIKIPAPDDAVIIGPEVVNVRVHLRSAIESRTYVGVPVKVEGKSEYEGWSVSPQSVSVTIERSVDSSDPFDMSNPPFDLYVDVTNVVSDRIVLPVLTRNVVYGMKIVRAEPPQVTLEAAESAAKR